MDFCLNGCFYPAKEMEHAPLFRSDPPLGSVVFETLRTYKSTEVFAMQEHLKRLKRSVEICGEARGAWRVASSLWRDMREGLEVFVEKNKASEHDLRLKLLLSREDWAVCGQVLEDAPARDYEQGVAVKDVVFERPLPEAKYVSALYLKFQAAQEEGIFETLFFDTQGFLREGNISNVFAVSNGVLITPDQRILRGVTRAKVLARAKELGLPIQLREISREELTKADEIFLTNTTKEILPVGEWGEWKSQTKNMSKKLHKAFQRKVS